MFTFKLAQIILTASAGVVAQSNPSSNESDNSSCKCLPGASCWPSEAEWSKLNDTIDGHLIKYVPLAAVCYTGPLYNKEACETVNKAWNTSKLHVDDPGSVIWPIFANYSCMPTLDPNSGSCTGSGYPTYIVNASKPEYAQAGVKFVKEKNIRLNIKGTGHDFKGKSTAHGSLSIWTLHMQTLEFHDSFKPKSCDKVQGHSAATIGAGQVMADLYKAADERGQIIIGAADGSVGIGGYLLGGGHSPISASYGLASQQAIEFQIVTPNGELVTANECENPDLYWAMCGGGGGTFGVMTQATVKTHPTPKISLAAINANLTSNNTDLFWEANGMYHEMLPSMVDAGVEGYYTFLEAGPHYSGFSGTLHVVNKPGSALKDALNPFLSGLSKGKFAGNFAIAPIVPVEFPTFYAYWKATLATEISNTAAGALVSRIMPRRAFTENSREFLTEKLHSSTGPVRRHLIGHLVCGPAVRNNKGNIVNPSWRDCDAHLVVVVRLEHLAMESNEKEFDYKYDFALDTADYNLRSLAPKSGAYLNEALWNDDNWQVSFFGNNYPRLAAIKEKYDPDGLLYCNGCPGSEKWMSSIDGTLCKVPWAIDMKARTGQN